MARFASVSTIPYRRLRPPLGVVLEDAHAVQAAHRHEGVAHVVVRVALVLPGHHGELAVQHLRQEVAVVACGLEEARLDVLGLLLDHVEHGVDLALVGEDLPVVLHSLARFDLLSHGRGPVDNVEYNPHQTNLERRYVEHKPQCGICSSMRLLTCRQIARTYPFTSELAATLLAFGVKRTMRKRSSRTERAWTVLP